MDVIKRFKLLLFVGLLVLPTALAYISYSQFNWRPSAHKNYGELLPAMPLANTTGVWSDGTVAGFELTRGKWVLTYVGPSKCAEACRQSLYFMRQARILQDSERYRIELVWVVTDAGEAEQSALQATPGLRAWRSDTPALTRQFVTETANAGHIYFIDPLGNPILRFPTPPDAKRMVKDIKLLLKASQIG
jgi:hypothetical protein